MFRSDDYNYNFRIADGYFQRWGAKMEDDPVWSPFGNEILDIEISASGKNGGGCPISCPMCYKGNNSKPGVPDNMTLDVFNQILCKFPQYNGHYFLTQIAFGITSIGSHPEIFNIFQCCRDNNIVPNVTINGSDPLTDEQISMLVKLTGAMAISVVHPNEERAYKLMRRLLDAGARQLNIHYVIHESSISNAYKVAAATIHNPLLSGMNAIVFLGLKPKNRGQKFEVLNTDEYVKLIDYCMNNNISYGFDSCSSPKAETAIINSQIISDDKKHLLLQTCERCESGLHSAYIDVDGNYWHCSFGEGMEIANGIDVKNVKSFLTDVWHSEKLTTWRNRLKELNRECPLYAEIHIDPSKATGTFPNKI